MVLSRFHVPSKYSVAKQFVIEWQTRMTRGAGRTNKGYNLLQNRRKDELPKAEQGYMHVRKANCQSKARATTYVANTEDGKAKDAKQGSYNIGTRGMTNCQDAKQVQKRTAGGQIAKLRTRHKEAITYVAKTRIPKFL